MKYICTVCGQVIESDTMPEVCPVCGAKTFKVMDEENKAYADEHRIGVAKGLDERIVAGLREHFTGECSEVGMYLAMSRQADREGYPEIAEAFKRYAFEEADHAARIAEMLGEVVTDSTEKNVRQIHADFAAFAGEVRGGRIRRLRRQEADCHAGQGTRLRRRSRQHSRNGQRRSPPRQRL